MPVMGRIRVCQLITELRPFGAERGVYELARRLDRAKFDVQVIGLRGGEVADWLAAAGVPASALGLRGKWDLGKLAKLAALLRQWRPDILHTHLFHADLAGRAAGYLAGVKHLLHTVHVAEARFLPWRFAMARLLSESCERIICVSPSVLDHHARRSGLPLSKYRLIPNGIDIDAYVRDRRRRSQCRAQWGVAQDQVVAAFVGRLDVQKGIDTLLEAIGRLRPARASIRFVLAGEGPLRARVAAFVGRHENQGFVRHLGFVHDVRAVLSAADMLVMPSRWEGFGLAAVEAMAAGLPVIASDVAGLREVVVDKKTGLLIPRENAAILADSILALANDAGLRTRLGESGLRRAREHYGIEKNVLAHERLYELIADPSRQ